MSKKQYLSQDVLSGLLQRADELDEDIRNALAACLSSNVDELSEPYEAAKMFALLASGASDMAKWMIIRAQFDERARELQALKQNVA